MKMILDTIGTGVEKAELRVKRSAKKAEKKQEATMLRRYDSSHHRSSHISEYKSKIIKVQWSVAYSTGPERD